MAGPLATRYVARTAAVQVPTQVRVTHANRVYALTIAAPDPATQRLRDKSSRSRPSYGGCVMFSDEAKYILERALAERTMAKRAAHPNAVAAHEELAQLYDTRLNELTRPTLHIAA